MNSFPLWYIRIHIVSSVYGGDPAVGRRHLPGSTRLGWGNAVRFLLTAGEFGATEALRIGLVQEVVPRRSVARPGGGDRLRGRRPGAVWVQRTLANARAWHAEAKQAAAAHLRELPPAVLASQDAAEGLRSFVERRAGRFTGR